MVLTKNGKLYGWGRNDDAKLGVEDFEDRLTPTHVPMPFSDIVKVFCGGHYSMVVTKEKKLYGWGWNYRELLTSRLHGEEIKKPFLMTTGVVDVACGWGHRLAFMEDGTVVGWGWNERGQLGLGHMNSTIVPEVVQLGEEAGEKRSRGRTIVGIVANSDQSYLVAGDGSVWAMGDTTNGRLGLGANHKQCVEEPTLIEGLKVTLPLSENWGYLFRWIFMAWKERASEFHVLPVEAIYHFVSVFYSDK
jgi:alpha-tubulin suppressor-like RCC1 family protein